MLKTRSLNTNLIESVTKNLKLSSDDGKIYFYEYSNKTEDYNLPYCCKLSLKINGVEYKSWGNGFSKDEASFKCVMELVERIIYKTNNVKTFKPFKGFFKKSKAIDEIESFYPRAKNWIGETSSGIAIHSNLKKAKEHALNELVERHIVLKALACNIKPQKIKEPKIIDRYTLPANIKTSFYYWTGPFNIKVVICQVVTKEKGAMYSFGSDEELENAIEKAFLEATGMIIYAAKLKQDKKENFSEIDMEAIRNYHLFSGDNYYFDFFDKADNPENAIDKDLLLKDIYFTKLENPSFLGNIPFVAVKCVSPVMQPLFFDYWKTDVLNPAAISLNNKPLPRGLHVIT